MLHLPFKLYKVKNFTTNQINFLHKLYSELQISQSLWNCRGGLTIQPLLVRLSVGPVACGTTGGSLTGDSLPSGGVSSSHKKSSKSNNAGGGASLVLFK